MDPHGTQVVVIDASVAIAWYISRNDPHEAGIAQQAIHAVMSNGALVPHLWFVEIANALVTAERRQVSNAQASARFLADLDSLPITVDDQAPGRLQAEILKLGRSHQLTAYDATYLELALRKKTLLATFDRQLAEAARSAGVTVFGDPPQKSGLDSD